MKEEKDISDNWLQTSDKDQLIQDLIHFYGEEMKRLIFTYVKDFSITDDIFQDVLVTVYLKVSQFKLQSSFKTWLFRITVNKSKDYLRSWYFRRVQISDSFKQMVGNKSMEDITLSKETSKYLGEVILSLPVKYREVIILYYYKDLKVTEISEVLKLNSSTVRTRLNRARKLLENNIGGDVEWLQINK
ncbi:sigma-70 family RNA polymerase sigma factor [Aquibacillus kalidii]|uniref:sigma-70 family RNA polymerase sigma factor n=1 Tax=Aquibacillus kalidii TaxID=2762597 RepID=UPI0016448CDD|nr:sigma-70 family RNA polymerase sigma factor [Aquibacillus kalidii]